MPPLSPALVEKSPAALICLLFFYLLYFCCVLRPATGPRALRQLTSAATYPELHADVIATAGIIAAIRNRLGRSRNRAEP